MTIIHDYRINSRHLFNDEKENKTRILSLSDDIYQQRNNLKSNRFAFGNVPYFKNQTSN